MRATPGRWANTVAIVLTVLIAGCSPDEADVTTSIETPVGSTTTTTTSATATTLAVTTTSVPEPTTTTAQPAAGALLVVGDWGSGTMPQGAVAGAMSRYAEDNPVAAILTTGDNFYSDDTDFIMQPFGWAIDAGIPFWVSWGNHDVETDQRIAAIGEIFDEPPRWGVYEWGTVDVVVLDSTQPDNAEQARFFVDALAASEDPTIVAFHHPPYSCGDHGETESIQEEWLDDLDDDVFLVLSGHEHNYQRFETSAVTYVVTGGGGGALTELTACSTDSPERVAGESTHHFLVLEQNDDVSVRAMDVNGGVIDQFTLGLP